MSAQQFVAFGFTSSEEENSRGSLYNGSPLKACLKRTFPGSGRPGSPRSPSKRSLCSGEV